jgi:uncharacterized protein YraI
MNLSKISKVVGLGAAVVALSAGAALAATATASVNVRTGPGTQYRAIDTLSAGQRVSVVDQSGGWCAVEKPGANGWVSCRYLTDGNYRSRPTVTIAKPSVSIQLGFGNTPRRDRDWDRNDRDDRGRWDRDDDRGYWSGPRSSRYSTDGGFFGLSIGN